VDESAAPAVALGVIVLVFRATGVSDRSYLVAAGDDALVVEGGHRAAIAASILDAAGFRNAALDGGGVPDLLWRP
jgi:rhodanese-related sulfurtransferase